MIEKKGKEREKKKRTTARYGHEEGNFLFSLTSSQSGDEETRSSLNLADDRGFRGFASLYSPGDVKVICSA